MNDRRALNIGYDEELDLMAHLRDSSSKINNSGSFSLMISGSYDEEFNLLYTLNPTALVLITKWAPEFN